MPIELIALVGGAIAAFFIIIGLKRWMAWADETSHREAVEKQMRYQLKTAEYETAAAKKIAREKGWDK